MAVIMIGRNGRPARLDLETAVQFTCAHGAGKAELTTLEARWEQAQTELEAAAAEPDARPS